jgi:hypothetical protein
LRVIRDGWIWELLRDASQTPSTATLLRKFVERFSNGALPQDLWAYLAFALLYPLHKKLPEERTSELPRQTRLFYLLLWDLYSPALAGE